MRAFAPLAVLMVTLAGCGEAGESRGAEETTTSTSTSTTLSTEPPEVDGETPIGAEGIGMVKAGMTLAEVREVGGRELVLEGFQEFEGYCWIGHFEGLKADFYLLFLSPDRTRAVADPDEGVLGRVSAEEGFNASPARTETGVGIGSTKAEVLKAYESDVLEVTPHAYTEGGEYIDVSGAQDPVPTLLRFETSGDGRVTAIHGGLPDAAKLVEACA